MDKNMKICFLDLDGVMNSQLYYMSDRFKKGSDSMMEYHINQIDPLAIDFLNDFVKETDCKIVISSVWRETAFEERTLYHAGFKGDIIDVTPHLDFNGTVRGNEILQWIKNNEDLLGSYYFDFKNYVIFDDDSDMLLSQRNNFFQTDTYCGLTFNTTHRAKRFLQSTKNIED